MSDSRKDAKHKAAMEKQKASVDANIEAASTERGVAILLTGNGKGTIHLARGKAHAGRRQLRPGGSG